MSGGLSSIWLISRAIASDQLVRRKTMFIILVAALGMLFVGAFGLWEFFVDHPLFFAIYWLVCGWLVITSILLAIYDMLQVLRHAREARQAEKNKIFRDLH